MTRKRIAFLLAILMTFAFVLPTFAETTDPDDPETETPESAKEGKTTTTETIEVLEDGSTVRVITSVTVIPSESDIEEEPAETEMTKETDEEIVILFTNDVHCAVEKNIGYGGVALLKNSLIDAGKNVLLVDCGDAVQGDTIGSLSKGEYIIDLMNKTGYDIATIGNHEFDYGMEQFRKNLEKAVFPYICCNFTDEKGKQLLDSYRIFEIAGKKVAFVGVDTPATFTSSTPTYFQDSEGNYIYSFCEDESGQKLYDTVQQAVNGALAEGADYVIVLAHLGIGADDSPWTSSELINHTNGIDVVLDGHSHSVIENEHVKNIDGKTVILSSTGTLLENVGCLTIGEDGKMDTMLLDVNTVEFGVLNGSLKNDRGVYELIGSINEEFSGMLNKVVAHTDYDLVINDPELGIRIIRSQETNLGDLCADAYRFVSGADIALVNGGAIRATIPAGTITYGSVVSVHPFDNKLSVAEASGQEILDALEFSAQFLPGEFGGFMQVSGITFTIDLNVDSSIKTNNQGEFVCVSGERRIKNVKVLNSETGEYEALDPEKIYTVAGIDYTFQDGGDGFTMFKDNFYPQSRVMPEIDILITYIQEKLGGTVSETYRDPYGLGRIEIVEKGSELPEDPEESENSQNEETPDPEEQPAWTAVPELNG